MRRALAVGLIGLAVTLLSATPAAAQWSWIRWIQELSGPGPFDLHGVTMTFGCALDGDAGANMSRPAYRHVFCDTSADWRHVKRFMGATFAVGDGKNNLEFPATREGLETVKASLYSLTGAFRPDAAVDVGGSIGFMRFTATPEFVVTKFVLEPYVAVRPLALFLENNDPDSVEDRLARAVELNLALIIFPEGFHVREWGASGGPDWSGKPEAVFRWGLRVTFVF